MPVTRMTMIDHAESGSIVIPMTRMTTDHVTLLVSQCHTLVPRSYFLFLIIYARSFLSSGTDHEVDVARKN